MLVIYLKIWYDVLKGSVFMPKSVFNKKIPHSCEYCVYGTELEFEKEILCKKHGVTELRDSCRSYKYDPLKRKPQMPQISENYKPEDFKL